MLIRYNHGQTCTAGTRVFVHESVYDRFLVKFTEVVKVRLSICLSCHFIRRTADLIDLVPLSDLMMLYYRQSKWAIHSNLTHSRDPKSRSYNTTYVASVSLFCPVPLRDIPLIAEIALRYRLSHQFTAHYEIYLDRQGGRCYPPPWWRTSRHRRLFHQAYHLYGYQA